MRHPTRERPASQIPSAPALVHRLEDVDALARLPDDLLATRAQEGDDEAFAVLVRRHSGALLALAGRLLNDPAQAEDAVQDALLSAWRRLPEFRHHAAFRTWIYRITVNRCHTIQRSSRPPPLPLDGVPEPAASDPHGEPASVAQTHAAAQALAQALARLDAGQRVCWVLRELHDLHYSEIAQITDTTEPTVRGRLFRARQTLTKAMDPWR
ncbi:RNA polymerase sigma factor [Streptomyces sp. NPDC059753]|uniref:RNA polymerase sigma factor n=1 Tax=Streptomyces sp. NPDC059753 TaxID=3346933 RepID=UPI003669FB6D